MNKLICGKIKHFECLLALIACVFWIVSSLQNAWAGGPLSDLYFPTGRPDTVMILYGPDSRDNVFEANNDLYPGSMLSGITAELEAERTYFIKIQPDESTDRDNTGYYLISISGPGSSDIFIVPIGSTELIVNDPPYRGRLKNGDDENMYVFRTAAEGEYTISMQFDPTQIQPGVPNLWKTLPVPFNIDRGPLGDVDEETIVGLVRNSLNLWNDVPTSSFEFTEGSRLETDVDRDTLGVSPVPRHCCAMFYDASRQTVLLFGGYNGSTTYGDMWEWDGALWKELEPDDLPLPREAFGFTYDSSRQEHILFGGLGRVSMLDDMWAWDGENWKEIQPESTPDPRTRMSMAYDEKRNEIVLFGGVDYSKLYGDTWVWDGTDWTEKKVSGGPSPRVDHCLFYDPFLQKVILFGGFDGLNTYRDMWAWDGQTWSRITFTKGPRSRDTFSIAYDPNRAVNVLFGGMDANGNFLNDMWYWNGNGWTEASSEERPTARQGMALAYDEERKQMLMFGGENGEDLEELESLGDTWAWNGQLWTELHKGSVEFATYLQSLTDNGINPIIFDNNGDLTELLNGIGSKEDAIGAASVGSDEEGALIRGRFVMNGWFLSEDAKDHRITLNELSEAVTHEFGHIAGVGHSQYYGYMRSNSYGGDEAYPAAMYPFIGLGDSTHNTYIRYDDRVAISDLYPADDGSFTRDYGSITGKALFSDGSPVLGGIVVARLVSDRLNTVVSRSTDELAAFTGDFCIPGLPPGQYEVWIEAANPNSFGASDVGYHSEYQEGPAFENPPRPEYYNGDNEGGDAFDNPSVLSLVEVTAGEETVVEFTCEELENKLERNAQILAYGSPMFGGFDGKERAYSQNPFSIVVTDDIQDFAVSITPYNNSQYGVRIDLDDRVVYSMPGMQKREGAQVVYDTFNKTFLLFGGSPESGLVNDLWSWDGNQWTLLTTPVFPKSRMSYGMAYDESRQQAVLFGGNDFDGDFLGDTWIWDGIQWTEINTVLSPSPRSDFAMAYDSQRETVLLFGGYDEEGESTGDLWEWNGEAWIEIPCAEAPPVRAYGTMVFDRARNRMVLYGGSNEKGRLNDTWEWDGLVWTEINTETAPDGRAGQAMVYDIARDKIFLFGGRTEEGRLDDLWEFVDGQWHQLQLPVVPSARSATLQVAYDSDRERMILFGGMAADNRILRDIWEFDGEQWIEVTPEQEAFSGNQNISFSRTLEGNQKLENGTYFIWVVSATDDEGSYSIVVTSNEVVHPTTVSDWELY